MIAYTRGTIKISEEAEPFQDENGQEVKYSVNYIKFDDGKVLELNSRDSYNEFEGKEGICKIKIVPQFNAKGYKLTLSGFKTDETSDLEQIEF